jgi:hypothetical protein
LLHEPSDIDVHNPLVKSLLAVNMKRLKGIIAFIALTILMSCEIEDRTKFEDQKLYFEFFAINYAWGFQYLHWVIDNNGNVLLNTSTDSIIVINSHDIKYGNANFDSMIYKVDQKELDHYINLIPYASWGKIKCEERNRADFGGNEYNAFYHDRVILLSSTSDIEDCLNKNYNAIMIDCWLKELQIKIFSQN